MRDGENMAGEPISSAELLARVREVVEERRRAGAPEPSPQSMFPSDPVDCWEVYPWRRPREGGRPSASRRLAFSVADLLALDDERFVRRAFHALIARDPAPAELTLWRGRGERGWPRLLVVAALRLSPEGQRRSVHVRGLISEFLAASLAFPLRRLAAWRRRS